MYLYRDDNSSNILDSLWKLHYDPVELELNPLLIVWKDKKDIKDFRGKAWDHNCAEAAFIIRV